MSRRNQKRTTPGSLVSPKMASSPPLPVVDRQEGIALFQQSIVSGPLPPPQILQQYDEIIPGSAERLLQLVEREQQQRHDLDRHYIEARVADMGADRREARLGQWLGFIVALVTIGLGATVALFASPGFGALISGSAVVGLVATFIRGRSLPAHTSRDTPALEGEDGEP